MTSKSKNNAEILSRAGCFLRLRKCWHSRNTLPGGEHVQKSGLGIDDFWLQSPIVFDSWACFFYHHWRLSQWSYWRIFLTNLWWLRSGNQHIKMTHKTGAGFGCFNIEMSQPRTTSLTRRGWQGLYSRSLNVTSLRFHLWFWSVLWRSHRPASA